MRTAHIRKTLSLQIPVSNIFNSVEQIPQFVLIIPVLVEERINSYLVVFSNITGGDLYLLFNFIGGGSNQNDVVAFSLGAYARVGYCHDYLGDL